MTYTNDVNVVGKYYGSPVNYGMPANGFTTTTTTVPFCGQGAPLAQPQYDTYQKEESHTGAIIAGIALIGGGIAAYLKRDAIKGSKLWHRAAQMFTKQTAKSSRLARGTRAASNMFKYAKENLVDASKLKITKSGKVKLGRKNFTGVTTAKIGKHNGFAQYKDGVINRVGWVTKTKKGQTISYVNQYKNGKLFKRLEVTPSKVKIYTNYNEVTKKFDKVNGKAIKRVKTTKAGKRTVKVSGKKINKKKAKSKAAAKTPVKHQTPAQYVESKFGLDALRAKTKEGYGIDFRKAESAIIADAKKKGIKLTKPVIPVYNEPARLDALKKQYISEITKKVQKAKAVTKTSNPFASPIASYLS